MKLTYFIHKRVFIKPSSNQIELKRNLNADSSTSSNNILKCQAKVWKGLTFHSGQLIIAKVLLSNV